MDEEHVLWIPIELWNHVFQFLDGYGWGVASSVCKTWKELVSDDAIWEAIYSNYLSSLNEDQKKQLLHDKMRKASFRFYPSAKFWYRSTCAIVPKEVEMEEYPSMEVPGHRTLRSGRFFGTREDAVAGVKEGDSIYFQAGIWRGAGPLVVHKNINIFGGMESRPDVNVVLTLMDRVVWNAFGDGRGHLAYIEAEQGIKLLSAKDLVMQHCVIYRGNSDACLDVGPGVSVKVFYCTFNSSVGLKLDPNFHSLELENNVFNSSCKIPNGVLMTLFNRMETAIAQKEIDVIYSLLVSIQNLAKKVGAETCIQFGLVDKIHQLLTYPDFCKSPLVVKGVVRCLWGFLSKGVAGPLLRYYKELDLNGLLFKVIDQLRQDKNLGETLPTLADYFCELRYLCTHKAFLKEKGVEKLLLSVFDQPRKDMVAILRGVWGLACTYDSVGDVWLQLGGVKVLLEYLIKEIPPTDEEDNQNYLLAYRGIGALWNFPELWTEEEVALGVPYLMQMLELHGGNESLIWVTSGLVHKVLEMKFTVQPRMSVAMLLLECNGVKTFLDLIQKYEGNERVSEHLWLTLIILSKTAQTRKMLSYQLPLTYDSVTVGGAKLLRLLCTHTDITDSAVNLLERLLDELASPSQTHTLSQTYKEPKVLDYALDSVDCLTKSGYFTENPRKQKFIGNLRRLSNLGIASSEISSIWCKKFLHMLTEDPELVPSLDGPRLHAETAVGVELSLDKLTVRCPFDSSFGSVRADFGLTRGKFYYEVKLHGSLLMQIGWTTNNITGDNDEGEGVGDDEYSWACDLYRKHLWHKESEDEAHRLYGEAKWTKGDILGCFVDLDKKYFLFSLNGKCLGIAYPGFDTVGKPLYPALSVDTDESCCVNFGSSPFLYPDIEEQWLEMVASGLAEEWDIERLVTPTAECDDADNEYEESDVDYGDSDVDMESVDDWEDDDSSENMIDGVN